MKKVVGHLRFFFDYGAGGCLWAGDVQTTEALGYGPVDCDIFNLGGGISKPSALRLSSEIKKLISELDAENYTQLNPDYQPDPSLWRQDQCDKFNFKIDTLLNVLKAELGDSYIISDKQHRYTEDPDLDDYLKDTKNFKRG